MGELLHVLRTCWVQQTVNNENPNPYSQTEKVDTKDFQRAVSLEVVLARRKHCQDGCHCDETENHKAPSDGGVSQRDCNITLIRKRRRSLKGAQQVHDAWK